MGADVLVLPELFLTGYNIGRAVHELAEFTVLPRFRRNVYFSSTGEGWGLYSEWLGYELGIYRTPYERFGAESYEMWRAARLVGGHPRSAPMRSRISR